MLESLNVSDDPTRFGAKVAFFAERSDISEEVTRMDAHLLQFRELLTGNDPVGRTLDFLTQEMLRITPLVPKSNRLMSLEPLSKSKAVDRLKEQVQNVE